MQQSQTQRLSQVIVNDTTLVEINQHIQYIKPEILFILEQAETQEYQTERRVVLTFRAMRDCYLVYIEFKSLNFNCNIATVTYEQCIERAKTICNDQNAGEKISFIMDEVERDPAHFKQDIEGHDELLEFFEMLKQKQ